MILFFIMILYLKNKLLKYNNYQYKKNLNLQIKLSITNINNISFTIINM
jgi:hypothetical protein